MVSTAASVKQQPTTLKEPETKVISRRDSKRTSGLSLKSIRAKKEHQIKQQEQVVDEENLPREAFTEEEMLNAWQTYVEKIGDDGKHNLASILSIDTPKLKDTEIHVTYPNSTNKVEVERDQYELMGFLRKTLSNYDVTLHIDVNETMEKKYAYSPQEKYEKLKDKNPNIEVLRRSFDLDL